MSVFTIGLFKNIIIKTYCWQQTADTLPCTFPSDTLHQQTHKHMSCQSHRLRKAVLSVVHLVLQTPEKGQRVEDKTNHSVSHYGCTSHQVCLLVCYLLLTLLINLSVTTSQVAEMCIPVTFFHNLFLFPPACSPVSLLTCPPSLLSQPATMRCADSSSLYL